MRRNSRNHNGENGTLWISFSDLMSALMLIFVLILFYAVYQYYDMVEIKTAELLEKAGIVDAQSEQLALSRQELESKELALSQAQQELESKEEALSQAQQELGTKEQALSQAQSALETKEQALSQAQQALESKEQELDENEEQQRLMQTKLSLQENALNAMQSQLSAQEDELNAAQTRLVAAQAQLDEAQRAQQAQQALLTEQQTQLEAQQAQLDKLVGVKSAIIEDLMRALADSNISGASVDDSGAIVFSSEMMFDVNRSTLKDVGKAFLNSFIPGYLKVLMSDKYSPNVSQIIIEGHTDTDGTFLKNMQLSQERAYAVLRYILSDEFTGITDDAKRRLEEIVTVNGRSYSDPIYREDGRVDMAASRRVVIKFRMNDEQMINEMISILDNMN